MELQYKICFVKAKQCSPIYFFHLIIPLKVHDIELDWLRSVNDIAELSSVNETAESRCFFLNWQFFELLCIMPGIWPNWKFIANSCKMLNDEDVSFRKLLSTFRNRFKKLSSSSLRDISINVWMVSLGLKPAYLLDQVNL